MDALPQPTPSAVPGPLESPPGPVECPTATQRHRDAAVAAARSRRGSRWHLRVGLALLLTMLAALVALGVQSWRTADLEQRLAQAQARVGELDAGLQRLREHSPTHTDVQSLRDALGRSLDGAEARVSAVEAGSVAHIVARVGNSVALIQGRYLLLHPGSARPVRIALVKGEPRRLPDGSPHLTLAGRGPVYAPAFTGTAFVVDGAGTLLTNRHIALPWEKGVSAQAIRELGVRPVLVELRGFLPGTALPFGVKVVGVSTGHDLALLRGDGAALTATPLRMATLNPAPGDAALVLGYPTGLNALLARADDAFVARLGQQPDMNDQRAADALAQAGLIQPLVSRGIVAQVSDAAIVYDAQTTSGGSGGPVINLRGEVLAINRAVLAGYGGSNLGVPVVVASAMLQASGQLEHRGEPPPVPDRVRMPH